MLFPPAAASGGISAAVDYVVLDVPIKRSTHVDRFLCICEGVTFNSQVSCCSVLSIDTISRVRGTSETVVSNLYTIGVGVQTEPDIDCLRVNELVVSDDCIVSTPVRLVVCVVESCSG